MDAPRVLILTASIGEGHDLPARVLAAGIREECPGAQVEVVDFLDVVGGFAKRIVLDGSRFDSEWGNRMFDLEYRLIAQIGPTRRLAGAITGGLAGRPAKRAVREASPDVVVSTYPGSTEALGRLRARGRIDVPVVSAITDLASLWYWAHPGVDLHLITHPESGRRGQIDRARRAGSSASAASPTRPSTNPATSAGPGSGSGCRQRAGSSRSPAAAGGSAT